MTVRRRVSAKREENQHVTKFKILGKMKKKSAMNIMTKEDIEYFDKPYVVDHIPGYEYVYLTIPAGGLDYHNCKICYPHSHEVVDNRRASGS